MTSRLVGLGAAAALALVLLSSPDLAQQAGPGLILTSSSGASAGSFLPLCTVDSLALSGGDAVSIGVFGDFQAPYFLFVSATASQCQPIPGFGGGVVLDPPLALVAVGTLGQVSPCLSCPAAFDQLTVNVPVGIPAGFTLALQALSFGAGLPALTAGVTTKFT